MKSGDEMVNIGILLCIIMVFVGKFTEKKLINPITTFYALWLIIIALSSLQLFRLKGASGNTYYLIIIGLFAYGIGYYITRIFNRKYILLYTFKQHSFRKKNKVEYVTRYWILYVLGIISILFYLYDFSIVFSYLLNGNSLGYIRKLAQDPNSVIYANRSVIENAIRILVVTPFVTALQPILAADFWIGKKDKKIFIIDVIIIMLRVITDGSRIILVYLLFHLLVASLFANNDRIEVFKGQKSNKNIKLKKILITMVLIIGGFALYQTTLSRSGVNALRYIYYYFSMEPYMFELWAKSADSLDLLGYGLASTNGFWFALFYVIKNVFNLSNFPSHWYAIYNLIQSTDTQWQIIAGEATTANAYVSLFWFLYLDGRILGIIIGMFIYGLIAAKVFFAALKQTTTKSVCVYSIILQGICFSFVRLQFADIFYTMAFMFILFIVYKPNRVKKELPLL